MAFNNTTRLQGVLYDALANEAANTLAAIKAEATRIAGDKADAKEAREDATEAGGSLWSYIRDIAKSAETSDHAAELDGQQIADVVTAVITDAVKEDEAAAKSVKPYASTARKIVTAVREKRLNWHQTETKLVKDKDADTSKEVPVTYADVRDMLKSDGQKEVDSLKAKVAELVREIAGRENDVRNATTRANELLAVIDFLSPMADKAKRAREASTQKAKTAAAANTARNSRQEVTTGPTVETRAA